VAIQTIAEEWVLSRNMPNSARRNVIKDLEMKNWRGRAPGDNSLIAWMLINHAPIDHAPKGR
jgi:hypothetical protein